MTASLRLSEIRLRNWKAYQNATLQLPAAESGQVVVIGGQNGAGKTSLMEALVLGLYGRDGLSLVARAKDRRRGEASYDGFLERALNRDAGAERPMTVELVFVGGPRGRIALERVWYFSTSGRHERDDEDVRIREGDDEDLVPIPEDGREAFLRAYVSDNLLPANLASFFIFDGEHVDRLAGLDLEGQVRSAVEAMLGVPLLRQTIQDLRAYARERRRDTRETEGSDLGALRVSVNALETREDAHRNVVEATNDQLTPLREERDAIVARIGSLHGDTYASFKGLFETRERLVRDRVELQEELRRALSVDLAFALAGGPLRRTVQARLDAETLRERWLSGLQTSDARYAAFVGLLEGDLTTPDALGQLRMAWEKVWNAPPDGSALNLRHGHLGDAERHLVSRHLNLVSEAAGSRIGDLARQVQATEAAIHEVEDRIARQNGVDEMSQGLAGELRRVQGLIADLEARHRLEVEALDEARQTLAPLKQSLALQVKYHADAAPVLRRADKAERYASVLEDVIDAVVPQQMTALSDAVTQAYRALAHKDEVARIEISAGGDVRLIDERGEDLRNRDASAGETQIFALALMAAIAATAPVFPIVMDTPFARLDPRHRRNVLRHFAELGPQLILLAHPAEIGPEDLEGLGARLAPPIEVAQDQVSRVSGIRPGAPS
ncbi:AAA family ATPase [Brevundimonas sp. SL130]|uniref:AAA family ATPase n=1 Tax=Brevundimonas sp. SL130 TaxID=2995143 RepID=UPI00226CB8F2|nr:AAA family ATPase [Brevundimonas sp. SL130]WAC59642.1 AAA family ATPase [Brevundimonas sp. SL130]